MQHCIEVKKVWKWFALNPFSLIESNNCYLIICYLMAQPLNTNELQTNSFVRLSTVRQCKNNRTINKSGLLVDVRAINRRKQRTSRRRMFVVVQFEEQFVTDSVTQLFRSHNSSSSSSLSSLTNVRFKISLRLDYIDCNEKYWERKRNVSSPLVSYSS